MHQLIFEWIRFLQENGRNFRLMFQISKNSPALEGKSTRKHLNKCSQLYVISPI